MLFGPPRLVGLSHSAVNNFPPRSPRFGIPLFAASLGFSPPSSSKLGAPVASLAPRAAGGGLGVLRRGQDPNPPALGVGLGVSHPFLLRGERAVGAVVGGSATASPPPHHGGAAMLAPRGGAPPRSDLKWHFSSCIFGASQTPAAGPGPPLGPGYPPLGLPCRARSPPPLFQPSARGEQTQRSVPPPQLVAPSWSRVWDLCDIPTSTAWVKKIKMHQNPPAPGCSLRPRGRADPAALPTALSPQSCL